MENKYVAYVGSYTYIGESKGIAILDVDQENGVMKRRKDDKGNPIEIPVNNPSYITVSRDGKILYSIADEGIVSFKILPDGNLEKLNTATIRGMRGCYIDVDDDNRYLFVAGYHDGKVTVLKLNEDGSVGEIADGFYDKGVGSVAERNSKPHISCVKQTPDKKFLCVVDVGIDQVKIFSFDKRTGRIHLVDMLRCELDSGPRRMMFSSDGKFMYMISELKNYITVYTYDGKGKLPNFELVQTIPTVGKKCSNVNAAVALKFSPDERFVLCSNAGDNSVGVFERDEKTGILTMLCVLPISGGYPKDIGMLPDGKFMYSLNHETGTITFFEMHLYEEEQLTRETEGHEMPKVRHYFSMNNQPLKVDQPNCCAIVQI